jgi:SAM-dependent methyltransferase
MNVCLLKLIKKFPGPIKKLLWPLYGFIGNKQSSELNFWKHEYSINNNSFYNKQYRKLMLAIAGENDESFIKGKVVADFGCGPCGSLVWAESAVVRIGIDVLVDQYSHCFPSILSHGMIYLKSTEETIPLPSKFVDVMFSLNAIDHVNNLPVMCQEIIRVIKPGGVFCCSFNLEEPATIFEPQRLTEQIIKDNLLDFLDIKSYRTTIPGPKDDPYKPFFDGDLKYSKGQHGFLWVKAQKPLL